MTPSLLDQAPPWAPEPWVRTVLDAADFVVLATDCNGIIRYAGGSVRAQLGYSPSELIGRSPIHLTNPTELVERAAALSSELGRRVEPGWETLTAKALNGRPDDAEWTLLRRNGEPFTSQLIVSSTRDSDGKIAGFTLVARDISSLRRVEEALRESEERFRGAFVHSAIGMALLSPDGYWLQANPAFCRMLEYTEEELRRLNFVQLSHPDDIGISITRDCELLGGARDSYQLLKRYVRKGGETVWAMVNASLVRGPDHRPLHFVAQIMDVTAQRQAEDALRESEERFRDLFENASDLIQCLDAEGRLLYVNRAWREKLGYAEMDISGLTLANVLHPEDRAACIQQFERILAGEPCGTIEACFVTREGKTIVVEGNVSCCFRDGKPAFTRGIFRDVTERRAFETLLDEYRRNLEDTNRRLGEANSRLEELATTDPLTGLKNRLVLQEKLDDEFHRAERYQIPLTLVLLDADHFKSYNDTFGHPAGDVVLKELARLLQESARTTDVVARFGGEEFAVLLPNTEMEGAMSLAERFRAAIEQANWDRRAVTASFGVAAWTPEMADASALVSAADAALYRAKQAGRNRVECDKAAELAPS